MRLRRNSRGVNPDAAISASRALVRLFFDPFLRPARGGRFWPFLNFAMHRYPPR
jgi:hypothetical protein